MPKFHMVSLDEAQRLLARHRHTPPRVRETVAGYLEHPVWVVTVVPDGSLPSVIQRPEDVARHTVIDARSARPITQSLAWRGSAAWGALNLHEPLAAPEPSSDEALCAVIREDERILANLPHSIEYGSRWRLIRGFIQVTDVWRVTLDTSILPPMAVYSSRRSNYRTTALRNEGGTARWRYVLGSSFL
jgi:hypothetical protein